eukprot:2731561-Amphidinium_carterae.1
MVQGFLLRGQIGLSSGQENWLFRDGQGSRAIASREVLGTYLACQLFAKQGTMRSARCRVSAMTCNKGNAFVMHKLLTTKLPLALLVMQLARLLDRRRVRLDLIWTPREKNALADALTNED